ncbi:EamA-like transporter family [Geoglobus ahangari]|uniref:EamA-like transporter family n=1 Tax=Geoglobus ahangari TaxID=113653 RepID=A0A0F7IFL1_9EURY|nr:DMT family transporter [Geoglobus ahangari]AKG91915.1 EamA-like transporter family [Geoglobus ahangari]
MIDLVLIALFFSLHQIFIRKGVEYGDANYGAFVSLLTTSVIFSVLSIGRAHFEPKFLALMVIAGIMHFLLARTAFYNAISRIGANSAGSISATRVFFAVIIGLMLGERVGINVLVMALLIFLGIYLISSPSGAGDWKGIVLALFTGLITAASSGVVKMGMEVHADPVFGSAIGYVTSTLLFPLFFKYERKGGERFFIPAGIFVGLGHFLRYRALISYPVSVVEPFLSIYPLFTLILTAFVFRSVENVTRNIAIGSILIIAGVESYYLL